MNTAKRRGLWGTVIALGVALALAALVTTSNTPVHANSAPDLEVGTPTVDDSSPYTGASFTLSATVTNSGDGESAATTLRYYRSTDATITSSDTEVGTDVVDALAASGTSEQSIDLTAPSTAGTYYFGACVDSVSAESDTSDNCSAALEVTVKARPDLAVGKPGSDIRVRPGATFTLSPTVSNIGDAESSATTLRYYSSYSGRKEYGQAPMGQDTEVGTDAIGPLAPDGQSDQSIELTAPTTLGDYLGRYRYGACVDKVAGEPATTNNCSDPIAVRVTFWPELTVSVSAPARVRPGARFRLWATITNEGDAAATRGSGLIVNYYRSEDSTITTSDTDLSGPINFGSELAAGSSNTDDSGEYLQASSTPGTYYYGACVVTKLLHEWDATNNCSQAVEVTVKGYPDLDILGGFGYAPPLVPGGSFYLTARLENEGDGEAPATTLRAYRSEDITITTSDTELDTKEIDAHAPGDITHHQFPLTAPDTPGTYYYGTCVDSVTGESDTTNNCSWSATVTVQQNSIATGAPTINGTAQVGQTLTADTSGISDADGLTSVSYSYQWLADDTAIDSATSSTYTLQSSDNGKVIKVQVTFTDDEGNEESLTSAGTSAVTMGGL